MKHGGHNPRYKGRMVTDGRSQAKADIGGNDTIHELSHAAINN
jgi:hypothetical protein